VSTTAPAKLKVNIKKATSGSVAKPKQDDAAIDLFNTSEPEFVSAPPVPPAAPAAYDLLFDPFSTPSSAPPAPPPQQQQVAFDPFQTSTTSFGSATAAPIASTAPFAGFNTSFPVGGPAPLQFTTPPPVPQTVAGAPLTPAYGYNPQQHQPQQYQQPILLSRPLSTAHEGGDFGEFESAPRHTQQQQPVSGINFLISNNINQITI
jgi:hypothetical protein